MRATDVLRFPQVFHLAFLICGQDTGPSGLQWREALQQIATSHRMKLSITSLHFSYSGVQTIALRQLLCSSMLTLADSHLLPDCLRASLSNSSRAASSSLSTSAGPALPRLPC